MCSSSRYGYETVNTDNVARVGRESEQALYFARALEDNKRIAREFQREEESGTNDNCDTDNDALTEEKDGSMIYGIVCEGRFRKLTSLCVGCDHDLILFSIR